MVMRMRTAAPSLLLSSSVLGPVIAPPAAMSMDMDMKLFLAKRDLVRARLRWDGSPRTELQLRVAQRVRECVQALADRARHTQCAGKTA